MAVKHYRMTDMRSGDGIEVTLGPENEMRVDVDGVCLFHAKGNVPETTPTCKLGFPETRANRKVWVVSVNDSMEAVVIGSRKYAESVAYALARAGYEKTTSFRDFAHYREQLQWRTVGVDTLYEEEGGLLVQGERYKF